MSKHLGKMLLEAGVVKPIPEASGYIRYVSKNDSFVFGVDSSVSVKASFLRQVLSRCGYDSALPYLYEWSIGYQHQDKKQANEWRSVYEEECKLFGGRSNMLIQGDIDTDYTYWIICVYQYTFKLNLHVLNEAKKQWKRRSWGRDKSSCLFLEKRSVRAERGPYNVTHISSVFVPIDDEVYQHNLEVALKKKRLDLYLDNERQHNPKYNRDTAIKMWQELVD